MAQYASSRAVEAYSMNIQHAKNTTGSMQSAGKSQEARLQLLERRMRGKLPSPQRLSFDGPDLRNSGRQVNCKCSTESCLQLFATLEPAKSAEASFCAQG